MVGKRKWSPPAFLFLALLTHFDLFDSNTSFFDDLLLQKTKGIVCQVLDNLNEHEEIAHVQALSSRETNERFSNVIGIPSAEVRAHEKARRKVTFEQFVENLDGQDQFVKNLVEILVSVSDEKVGREHESRALTLLIYQETVRQAIQKSVEQHFLAKQGPDAAMTPMIRSMELATDCEESRKLQLAIEKLTKASRRSDSWIEGYNSSSSSSSSESDLTVTPFDAITTLGVVPRAPPSVLQTDGDGRATTRSTREERNTAMLNDSASRPRRLELMAQRSQRARTSRLRQTQILELRNRRRQRHEAEEVGLQFARNLESVREQLHASNLPPTLTNQDEDPTANLIHRFLTQPFPSETRSSSSRSSRRDLAQSSSEANEIDLLTSIYGDADATSSPPPAHVDPVAINLEVNSQIDSSNRYRSRLREEGSSRLDDFEAFANTRRQDRRTRGLIGGASEGREDGENEGQEEVRQTETFYRALDTLFQADETIRQISQDAEESAETTTTNRGARRYQLPALNVERPVVRLPNRSPRRREGEQEQ